MHLHPLLLLLFLFLFLLLFLLLFFFKLLENPSFYRLSYTSLNATKLYIFFYLL